jgi:hypothetical protein
MTDEQLSALIGEDEFARRERLGKGGRLVHYTSAESAYRILTGRCVWLRSAALMNDVSEITHGINCVHEAWASSAGLALQKMLDRLKPGLRNELAKLFDDHSTGLRNTTFLMSLSEHDDTEDELGRLSMWRAYGGNAGVALVLNVTAFSSTTDAIQAFSAPVFYANQRAFVASFEAWAGRLLVAEDQLRSANPASIKHILFHALRSFALCTKHPGFKEEREWRIFHSPVHERQSPWLDLGIEVVKGIPQPLVKLRLFDDEASDVSGVAPKTLINRVIIGPCENPLQIRAAMFDAMFQAGVENIDDNLWMSLIPLRQT